MKIAVPYLILLLAMAGGCVTQSIPSNALSAVERQTVQDKRIVIEPALSSYIRIVGVKTAEVPGGFLRIQINVQSMMDTSQQFNYRITWFDENGVELPMADSALLNWMLLPHETSFLAATAPTPSAKNFRVYFLTVGGS